jgi:hypothetical protein
MRAGGFSRRYQLSILVVILVLAAVAPASAGYVQSDKVTTFYYDYASGKTWENIIDESTATSSYDPNGILKARNDANTGKFDELTRIGIAFNITDVPEGYVPGNAILSLYFTINNNDGIGAGPISVVRFEPSGAPPWAYEEFNEFSDIEIGHTDTLTANNIWVNVSLDSGALNSGINYLGVRCQKDITGESPSWISSGTMLQETFTGTDVNRPRLYYDAVPDVPEGDPVDISVNLFEKYSNAILVNQAITVTPASGGAGATKTSLYGETLHFTVYPGASYWFNASRSGYLDYNETYTIPASPGIYSVYMERALTPIANHSYAHFSVVDQTNGGLIPNAEIRLSDGQTKLTNSAGYAWFSVNNSEQINYYVSKPSGYWPAYGAMNLTADESILVALQRYTGPTATATMPGWTPVTVPTTGTGVNPVQTLSSQLRQQNVQEGMDVWYTNLPFISQFLFLLFIIGGLGLMAGGTRRN